jgi:hypothetical protein
MKKQNPIYLFSTIMSLGVAGFVLFMLVSSFEISFFVIAIVFFLTIVIFVMYMANKLTTHSFENRYQRLKECENCKVIIPKESEFCPQCGTNLKETIVCEYCGHINKIASVVCEECNGLIG